MLHILSIRVVFNSYCSLQIVAFLVLSLIVMFVVNFFYLSISAIALGMENDKEAYSSHYYNDTPIYQNCSRNYTMDDRDDEQSHEDYEHSENTYRPDYCQTVRKIQNP